MNLHRRIGVPSERVPLSGAARYQGNGEDVDVYVNGPDAAPLVCQVKRMKGPRGTKGVVDALGDADALFIRYDAEPGCAVRPPIVVIPWSVWERLLTRR